MSVLEQAKRASPVRMAPGGQGSFASVTICKSKNLAKWGAPIIKNKIF